MRYIINWDLEIVKALLVTGICKALYL